MPRSTTPPAPSSQAGSPAVRAVDTSTAAPGGGTDATPAGPGTVLVSLPEWHSPLSVGLASLLSDQPGVHLVPSATISSSPQRGVLLHDAGAPPASYAAAVTAARAAGWTCLALAWPEEQRRLLKTPAAGPDPDGWLPKSADGPTLAAAIRHAFRKPAPELSGPGTGARGTAAQSLSQRERQMLVLIAAGLSNDEIAARCYLSINSVKTFVRAAYRKIGVERRVDAAMWVAEHLETSEVPELADSDVEVDPGSRLAAV